MFYYLFINLYLILVCKKNFIAKKKAKAIAIKNIEAQRSLLSLLKPNGIKPIKPPTATFVSLLFRLVNAPIKTNAKPINIIKIPNDVKLWFIQ